jgi:hypothetical protein
MNDPCPVCGLIFQREEGFFLGAMYISYPVSVAFLIPVFFLLSYLLPTWNGAVVALLALVPYLPFSPAVFRYSRVLWIYFDRAADPHGGLAGSYEKARLKQVAGPGRPPDGRPG